MWPDDFCVVVNNGVSIDLNISNAACKLFDTSENPVPVGERMFTLDSMTSRFCITDVNVDNKDAYKCSDNYCLL